MTLVLSTTNWSLLQERRNNELHNIEILKLYRDIWNTILAETDPDIRVLYLVKYIDLAGKWARRLSKLQTYKLPLWRSFNVLRYQYPHFLYTFNDDKELYYLEQVETSIYNKFTVSAYERIILCYQIFICLTLIHKTAQACYLFTSGIKFIRTNQPITITYPHGILKTEVAVIFNPMSERDFFPEYLDQEWETLFLYFSDLLAGARSRDYVYLSDMLAKSLKFTPTLPEVTIPLPPLRWQMYTVTYADDFVDVYQYFTQAGKSVYSTSMDFLDRTKAEATARIYIQALNNKLLLELNRKYLIILRYLGATPELISLLLLQIDKLSKGVDIDEKERYTRNNNTEETIRNPMNEYNNFTTALQVLLTKQ